MSAAPTYRVVVRSCTSYSPIDLTPGAVEAVFQRPTNIGYTEIVGNIPMMFFTLSQDDPQARAALAKTPANIFGFDANNAVPLHFELYRNDELVWGGLGPLEIDETSQDMIVYCYGHAASLYWTLTGWDKTWTGQTIKEIVDDAFSTGQAKANSMMAWLTSGTTQAPATTSGGSTDIILPSYKANYKRLLFLFRELSAYSASDTSNRVWFEVTPSGVFNFWKNKGATKQVPQLVYPSGNVLDFRRYRMPVDMRTKLYGVGTSPRDTSLRSTSEDVALSEARGLREDSIYMQWVRDSDELDRVTKRRRIMANKVDRQITLTMAPNSVPPIRATGGFEMMADYPIYINKGSVQYNGSKMLVGNQIAFIGGREYVRLTLQDKPS
jgi:hypothetical protein